MSNFIIAGFANEFKSATEIRQGFSTGVLSAVGTLFFCFRFLYIILAEFRETNPECNDLVSDSYFCVVVFTAFSVFLVFA